MADPTLKYKDELTKEPDYTGTQDEVGSSTQSCPQQNDEPNQKIKAVYFEDADGNKVQNISKEDEVQLIVETENMDGEELVLGLGEVSESLELAGQMLSAAKVMVFNVGSTMMKTALKVIPKRLKDLDGQGGAAQTQPPATGVDEDKAKIVSIEFLDG